MVLLYESQPRKSFLSSFPVSVYDPASQFYTERLHGTDYLHFIKLAEKMLLLLADIQEPRKAFVCLNVWPLSNIDPHFAVEHVCVCVLYGIYTTFLCTETSTVSSSL